jgi:gamma-glutamyl-gamma-aminobutyrate hydrolase PuuD
MSTRRILTPAYHAEILATPDILRAGVMAPLCPEDNVELCDRWSEPFIEADLETVIIPVGAPDIEDVLPHLDALLLPGGDSNIHPMHYREECPAIDDLYDLKRDAFAFKLIEQAYALNLPTLGICRGMQEMVVAFGGALEKIDSDIDHAQGYKNSQLPSGARCTDKMDWPIHPINIVEGGLLHDIYGALEINVNSIHGEGISKALFESLKALTALFDVEAYAPDDIVEAITAKDKRFFVGVQPHFEIGGPLHDALFDRYFSHIFAHHNTRPSNAPQPAAGYS